MSSAARSTLARIAPVLAQSRRPAAARLGAVSKALEQRRWASNEQHTVS